MQIILCGNSPGELWGWVRPVASRLAGHDLSLFLLPCPYATGREKEVAEHSFGITNVYTPKESLAYIFRGKKTNGMVFEKPIILHLGGDVMYAALLARRLKTKAYAYQWANKFWDRWMTGYFVSSDRQKEKLIARGISPEKITVTGDLLLDSINRDTYYLISANTGAGSRSRVTFLPGSREIEAYHMLPFYLRIVEAIEEKLPGTEFRLAISPFMTEADIARIILKRKKYYLDSSSGVLNASDGKKQIRTEHGTFLEVGFGEQYRYLRETDCAVTVPGTKCGEAGILGIPMVVLLPTNKLEMIPYPGFVDFAGKIPVLGPMLKRFIGSRILPKLEFLAQPNILAGRAIVPELVGKLKADIVAESVVALLRNREKRIKISKELHQIYDLMKPGADSIAEVLLAGGV